MDATAAPGAIDVRQAAPFVVTIASQKGGTGKTTLALALAATTADSSGRCVLADVDPQQSATEIAAAAGEALPFEFAAEHDPGVLEGLRRARNVDTIIVDTPGSLENTGVLREVLRASDLVLIPFVPERQAVTPTMRTAELARAHGVEFRICLNLVDPLRGPGPVESAWQLLDSRGLPRLRSFVRRYVAHSQAQLEGQMITQYHGDRSWRPALDDIRRVHTEVLILLGRMAQERGR